jgi:hypothetical protein
LPLLPVLPRCDTSLPHAFLTHASHCSTGSGRTTGASEGRPRSESLRIRIRIRMRIWIRHQARIWTLPGRGG